MDTSSDMANDWVVLDASVAIKAILPNPLQRHCLALVHTFAEVQPVAPSLWAYETTSALTKSIHLAIITKEEGRQALFQLDRLGVRLIVPDIDLNLAALNWTIRLSRVSACDSYYLALAEAMNADYWTADRRLYNALKEEGLAWLHHIQELEPLDS